MILKAELACEIYLNELGQILIKQFPNPYDEETFTSVTLSYNQFKNVASWVRNNKRDILCSWGNGVEYEEDDEELN